MLDSQQVAFDYPNHGSGLLPTTLAIQVGELVVVSGPSGSGKSTLARCLTGLIPHLYHGTFSGEVRLNGYTTTEVPLWQLAEKAGMVFQNPAAQMLAPSVEDEIVFGLENLGLEPGEITQRLERVLDQFGLAAFRARGPLTLSGGEQQKLALAAVFARQPQVLVLDEPLSMLDTTAATELVEHLGEICRQGTTVVVFEHRQEFFSTTNGARFLNLDGVSQVNPAKSSLKLASRPAFRLDIEALAVDYPGRRVLDNFNLRLESGQVVAVVGRNGVGKTTLVRTIAGLQKVNHGRVRIVSPGGDENPDMGMVFQNPDLQLFNASVRDEILYRVPDPDLVFYEHLVESLGLTPYENTPPLLLSEGEKKRLALALVMMQQPSHGLLLDEPSLGQDQVHKEILIHNLHSMAESGRLVILTTHDLTLASQADRMILLGSQGIVADGPTDFILQDGPAWEAIGIHVPEWLQTERAGGVSR